LTREKKEEGGEEEEGEGEGEGGERRIHI